MNVLKKTFNLYLKSSIHVALAVVSFTAVTMLQFEIPKDVDLLLYIFFGTITGYNFVKYANIAKLNHLSLTKNLRAIQVFSLFCFIALIYFALKQPLSIITASGILGVLTVLYALPFLNHEKNLRNFSGLKIFIIAFVWAGVTVVLPVLNAGGIYIFDFAIQFIQRFLFVIVLTLPFDIRDLRVDLEHLGTIPQQFGIKKTQSIGTILLSLIVFLEIFTPVIQPAELVAFLIIVIITYFLLKKAIRAQSQNYAAFWVEGVPILWYMILIVILRITF